MYFITGLFPDLKQQLLINIKKGMSCQLLAESVKNLTGSNGGGCVLKMVVRKNPRGEVTVRGI